MEEADEEAEVREACEASVLTDEANEETCEEAEAREEFASASNDFSLEVGEGVLISLECVSFSISFIISVSISFLDAS
jgi:hypothetical protein